MKLSESCQNFKTRSADFADFRNAQFLLGQLHRACPVADRTRGCNFQAKRLGPSVHKLSANLSSPTFSKLFIFLIDRRLRLLQYRIWRNQKGFLRGVSTDDVNFLLLRLKELSFRWQDFPLYVIFLDWVKCCDKIHHGPLLDALRRFGLPQQYLDVITARLEIFCSRCVG